MVLESTQTTPFIKITDGYIKIRGKSIPAINLNFYCEILNNLKTYLENPVNKTIVDIQFDYMNCYTKRSMMEIFWTLEAFHKNGNGITINWYYSSDDDSMLELGQIYQSMIKLPFNFIIR